MSSTVAQYKERIQRAQIDRLSFCLPKFHPWRQSRVSMPLISRSTVLAMYDDSQCLISRTNPLRHFAQLVIGRRGPSQAYRRLMRRLPKARRLFHISMLLIALCGSLTVSEIYRLPVVHSSHNSELDLLEVLAFDTSPLL